MVGGDLYNARVRPIKPTLVTNVNTITENKTDIVSLVVTQGTHPMSG